MTLSVNKSLFQGLVHIYTSVIIEYITSHIDKKENGVIYIWTCFAYV